MNILLLIISILFYIAGIVGGYLERDIGMMCTGLVLGTLLLYWRHRRLKMAPELKRKKEEERRYRYYLTDEGKKAIMPYISKIELEQYSWNTLASLYASEQGQAILREKAKEEIEQEDDDDYLLDI